MVPGTSASPFAAVHATAQQLSRQPTLRALLGSAAPALLPEADEVAGTAITSTARSRAAGAAMVPSGAIAPAATLLASLARQLDPLALGMRPPGCYNTACLVRRGGGAADAALKTCKGCKIARWAGVAWQGGRGGEAVTQRCTVLTGSLPPAGTAMPPAPRSTGSATRRAASGWQLPPRRLGSSNRSSGDCVCSTI
jgi:hypothetical protein